MIAGRPLPLGTGPSPSRVINRPVPYVGSHRVYIVADRGIRPKRIRRVPVGVARAPRAQISGRPQPYSVWATRGIWPEVHCLSPANFRAIR